MMQISQQFYGKLRLADWIKEKFSEEKIKKLIDKFPYDKKKESIELDFWSMGPIEEKTGIWLYGQSENKHYHSFDIIVQSLTILDFNTIIAQDWIKTQYVLKKDKAASSIARNIDAFLHHAFTDMAPMHMDTVFNILYDTCLSAEELCKVYDYEWKKKIFFIIYNDSKNNLQRHEATSKDEVNKFMKSKKLSYDKVKILTFNKNKEVIEYKP